MSVETRGDPSRSQNGREKAVTSMLAVSQGDVTLHSKITHFQKYAFLILKVAFIKKCS